MRLHLDLDRRQDAARSELLASLNHPNIAHVYGFESATLADGSCLPTTSACGRWTIAAEGHPAEVLESAAAEQAFGVAIHGVPVGDGTGRLWRFEGRG